MLVLKAALKEIGLLGQQPFRGMSQYLTGHYTGLKPILQLQALRIAPEQWHAKYVHGVRLGHSLILLKGVADQNSK